MEKCQHHGAQRIKMPNEEDKTLYFKKIEAQERLPFTIYADFESILQPRETIQEDTTCLLYTSPSPRDATLSRMPSSA